MNSMISFIELYSKFYKNFFVNLVSIYVTLWNIFLLYYRGVVDKAKGAKE